MLAAEVATKREQGPSPIIARIMTVRNATQQIILPLRLQIKGFFLRRKGSRICLQIKSLKG